MKRLGFSRKANQSTGGDFGTLHSLNDWQIITTATDVNTLKTQGKYFLQATGNPNAPSTAPYYVKVEKARDDRLTQTVWAEGNIALLYKRVFFNNAWQRWEKEINQNELNTRFNNTNVGGRNLILGSNVSRTTHGTTNLQISSNVDYSLVRQLTIACDIMYKNAVKSTKAGSQRWRVGVEVRINFTDGTSQVFSSFQVVTDTATNYNARRLNRFNIPNGKTIKSIDNAFIQIWDITATEIMVKNPKLELHHIMTDYAPAPEDVQSEIEALKTAVAELQRKANSNQFGD